MKNYFVQVRDGKDWVTHKWTADKISVNEGNLYFWETRSTAPTKIVAKGFWSTVEIEEKDVTNSN